MYIQILLIAVAAGLLFELLRSHLVLRRALGSRAESKRLANYPSVTVIRPIKGLDAGADDNIQAALDHGYPGRVETLFVFDDETEPVYPLARDAIQARRDAGETIDARILFSGEPVPGRTGKLHAMIVGYQEAKQELIVFADSDIRPDKKALRILVETLLTSPDTGSAFAPVAVTEKPVTVGDAGYSLLLNSLYGPAAAEVARKNDGELPFIMGQFMVFTRKSIAAIGGLESAEGQLVDDMYLGARITAAGLRNRVSPHRVPIIQRDVSLGEFWRTYVRWITFSRSGLPGKEFKLLTYVRPILYFAGFVLALAALSQGWWFAALLAGLAPVGITVSNNRLHRDIGGGRMNLRQQLASFALLLVSPVVLVSTLFKREVNWRGRSYKLNGKSQLTTGRTLAADEVCTDCPQTT